MCYSKFYSVLSVLINNELYGFSGRGWGGQNRAVCKHFRGGFCRQGEKCPYFHPGVNCPQYWSSVWGSDCKKEKAELCNVVTISFGIYEYNCFINNIEFPWGDSAEKISWLGHGRIVSVARKQTNLLIVCHWAIQDGQIWSMKF